MADVELRPIGAEEFPAYFRTIVETFGEDPRDSDRELDQMVFEPERSLAGFDGDRIVATAGIYSRAMTLPGGPRPVAAVTLVSVAPTHRRRGVLTEMMRRELTELHEEQREPVAVLWASEGVIYGRFGYGLAARRAALTGRVQDMRLRSDLLTGAGRVRLASAEEARPHLERVYEQVRGREVGWLDRLDRWWDYRLYDPEHWRHGATSFRFALHTLEGGTVGGYGIYRVKQDWDGPARNETEVQVIEVAAADPQAYAAVWSFLTNLDLTRNVRKRISPLDEPLQHMVTDPRTVRLEVIDALWVRLADVGRALAERTYGEDVDIVVDVTDEFCPWNAGRWRLSGGPTGASCDRTVDPADLALSSAELGAAYLGGTTLATLAAAGRVTELRPGAVTAASRALAGDRQPWCPEVF
jgi:predicted acetyltransferase